MYIPWFTVSFLLKEWKTFGIQTYKLLKYLKTLKHSTVLLFLFVAMETVIVPYDAQGPVTFPSHTDGPLSSSNWTSSGKQYIILPKALFSRKNNSSASGKLYIFTCGFVKRQIDHLVVFQKNFLPCSFSMTGGLIPL